jgi:putative membrane protein
MQQSVEPPEAIHASHRTLNEIEDVRPGDGPTITTIALAITTSAIKGESAMSRITQFAISSAIGVGATTLVASNAFAADGRGFGDGFGHHRGGGMMFFPGLILLIAVCALAAMLWRNRRTPATPVGPPPSPTVNAQSILADRLARGEINPDDYRAAIAVLRETA